MFLATLSFTCVFSLNIFTSSIKFSAFFLGSFILSLIWFFISASVFATFFFSTFLVSFTWSGKSRIFLNLFSMFSSGVISPPLVALVIAFISFSRSISPNFW